MHITDPVADMLTRIRNANVVYHEMVDMPLSKMRLEMARILKEEGYIRNYKTITDAKQPMPILRLTMNYGPQKERVIQGLRRISKPGRRIYVGKDELPKVMGGLGIALISTSAGPVSYTHLDVYKRQALISYKDGEKRYILAPVGLGVGDTVFAGEGSDIRPGNALKLKDIPVGTVIHNVELEPCLLYTSRCV